MFVNIHKCIFDRERVLDPIQYFKFMFGITENETGESDYAIHTFLNQEPLQNTMFTMGL